MCRTLLVVVITAVFSWAPAASAGTIWTEIGDAGNNSMDAQWTLGAGPLTQIVGNMFEIQTGGLTPLVDVYAIYVDDPIHFSATTVAPGLDPELFIFDKYGNGLVGNDNISDANLQAHLPDVNAPADIYFLWISVSGRDPGFGTDPGLVQPYPIFPPTGGTGLLYPLSGAGPLGGPTGESRQNSEVPVGYTIELQGVSSVPEPASLLLLGSGLGGLALAAWRGRK